MSDDPLRLRERNILGLRREVATPKCFALEWEAEHGAISAAELDALDQKVTQARQAAAARLTGAPDAGRRAAS